MVRKWWSQGLNPNILTQECRCLEALQRLIEGCEREGRGAEGCTLVHCGKPLNSSTPHSPAKAYPTLPEVGFVSWFSCPQWQWLLCNSAGLRGGVVRADLVTGTLMAVSGCSSIQQKVDPGP